MQAIVTHTVPVLDHAAQAIAWALSKVTRITGAGVFWHEGAPGFWDAWRDLSSDGGGSSTVRLGRLELVADWAVPSLPGSLGPVNDEAH